MKWKLAPLLAMVGFAIFTGCSDDSGDLDRTNTRKIQVFPPSLSFSPDGLNVTQEQTFSVTNVSENAETLKVTNLRISPALGDFGVVCDKGLTFDLTGGESTQCVVQFTPSTLETQNTNVVVSSNASGGDVTVAITTLGLQQQIEAIPPSVKFTVREGLVDRKLVKVRNVGSAPLRITGYEVTGQEELFGAEHDSELYGSITESEPLVLEPHNDEIGPDSPDYKNNELQVFVSYSPEVIGNDLAQLKIYNDTPGAETFVVELQASNQAPCILVREGTRIDFGNSRIGDLNQRVITVQNCGSDALDITRIEPGDNAATLANTDVVAPYLIDTGAQHPIEDDGTLQVPYSIPPAGTETFILGYAPTAEEPNYGKVFIHNTDPNNPRLQLDLFGRGVVNECPTAVARGSVQGVAAPPMEQVEAKPLDTLILDGSDSNDADGAVVDWVWETTRRPEGSVAELEPVEGEPNDPARRQFFLDLAGTYEFSMTAIDDGGANSCNTARVVVVVTPTEKIHIQLVWNNPEDPDQTDLTGADIDLHLLKMPIGRWFEQPYDNYFQNREPFWNAEHPSLDIDDTNGAGPENINMDDPTPCTWYAVGVHYWRQQFGTAYVTIRIFKEGGLAFEYPNKPLRTTNEWWDVARIHWPTGTVFIVDESIPTAPRGMPASITDEMNESGLCGLGN